MLLVSAPKDGAVGHSGSVGKNGLAAGGGGAWHVQYRYTPGLAGKLGCNAIPSRPRSDALFTPRSSTTLADPFSLVAPVRELVRQLDPDVPLYQIQTLEQQVSRSLWRQRLQGQVLGIFAALALVLAVVGLYSVVSYAVAQRTRELGVRIALGAPRRSVLLLVVAQAARLALAGVVGGLAAAFALSSVVSKLLYQVSVLDPISFTAAPLVLAIVALVASYAPARRATKVDPLVALRAE